MFMLWCAARTKLSDHRSSELMETLNSTSEPFFTGDTRTPTSPSRCGTFLSSYPKGSSCFLCNPLLLSRCGAEVCSGTRSSAGRSSIPGSRRRAAAVRSTYEVGAPGRVTGGLFTWRRRPASASRTCDTTKELRKGAEAAQLTPICWSDLHS